MGIMAFWSNSQWKILLSNNFKLFNKVFVKYGTIQFTWNLQKIIK